MDSQQVVAHVRVDLLQMACFREGLRELCVRRVHSQRGCRALLEVLRWHMGQGLLQVGGALVHSHGMCAPV